MTDIVFEVDGKKHELLLPECWNEVQNVHYPHLAHLFLKEAHQMNEYDKMVRAFCLLAQSVWPAIEKLSEEQIYDLVQLTFWVFERLDLSVNKIPEFSIKGTTYYGPADRLDNLRFGEFVMAETYFIQYFNTKDPNVLNKLIAVLYRPKGKGKEYVVGSATYRGDVRVKFNGQNVDDQAKTFELLNPVIRDAIYLFYVSARWLLFENFPHILPKGKNKSKGASSKPNEPNYGWIGVFDDICGEKGRTPEMLEDEFASTILMSLERTQIKWKKNKK
ncbi:MULTISPECIES: hypothetical protein [Olivibacter]|uniref:Uncharacterized protein n=1 Tax=Olivibacter jilunii TaxID=985016 RepID=A0ABW6AX14_9SPHI